jgi:hypothetical protein
MLGPASFGHPGSGGSLGAADPKARVGFGYVSNLWAATLIDPRAIELTSAVAKCLGQAEIVASQSESGATGVACTGRD